MPRVLWLFLFTITSLHAFPVRAAEIGCDADYLHNLPQEKAAKLWPSGRRPKLGVKGVPPGFALDPPQGAATTWPTCSVGYIRGEIEPGDYEKVLGFYRDNHPFLHHFKLQSRGGDVEEAIKIGRLLRSYQVTAEGPAFSSLEGLSC